MDFVNWKQRTDFFLRHSNRKNCDFNWRWKWKCPEIYVHLKWLDRKTIITLLLLLLKTGRKLSCVTTTIQVRDFTIVGDILSTQHAVKIFKEKLKQSKRKLNSSKISIAEPCVSFWWHPTYDQKWIINYQLKICQLLLTTVQMEIQLPSNNCNSWCWSTAVRKKLVFSKDSCASRRILIRIFKFEIAWCSLHAGMFVCFFSLIVRTLADTHTHIHSQNHFFNMVFFVDHLKRIVLAKKMKHSDLWLHYMPFWILILSKFCKAMLYFC